jgi:hypothetical protein
VTLLQAQALRMLTHRGAWPTVVVMLAVAGAALAASVTGSGEVAADRVPDLTPVLCVYLALAAFTGGAAWVGGELTGGGMATVLQWRPRRAAALGATLAVLLGAVFLLATVTLGVYLGTLAVIGDLPRTPAPGLIAPDPVEMAVRGVALALATAALGFALAALTGRTAGAMGLLGAYLAVWELGGRSFLDSAGTLGGQWFLVDLAFAWLAPEASGPTGPGVVIGVLVAVFLAASFAGFARRDVG